MSSTVIFTFNMNIAPYLAACIIATHCSMVCPTILSGGWWRSIVVRPPA